MHGEPRKLDSVLRINFCINNLDGAGKPRSQMNRAERIRSQDTNPTDRLFVHSFLFDPTKL